MATTEITLIGNEGFRIVSGSFCILIDAFYSPIPHVAGAPSTDASLVARADLILVTHAHPDHFSAGAVAEAAKRTGATVVGPAAVVEALRRRVAPEKLIEMEPAKAAKGQAALGMSVMLPPAVVRAYRTFHGQEHNSYLVELPGFRFFHDGDNEDTRRIPREDLARLDALLIGPWQGSGWVEFIETVRPSHWFLIHLANEELEQHEAGKFLPEICDRVPAGLTVLRPGQSFVFKGDPPC